MLLSAAATTIVQTAESLRDLTLLEEGKNDDSY
jgi:hypothetical protein